MSTVQIGTLRASYTDPNWNLKTGTGKRASTFAVVFPTPFTTPPRVNVSLAEFDIVNTANARLDVVAENVTTTEFTVMFSTWADTSIWSAAAAWIATE